MSRRLTDEEIEEGRRVMAIQLGTIPADRNIGPLGAWRRSEHIKVSEHGRTVAEAMPQPTYGLPTNRHLDRVHNHS